MDEDRRKSKINRNSWRWVAGRRRLVEAAGSANSACLASVDALQHWCCWRHTLAVRPLVEAVVAVESGVECRSTTGRSTENMRKTMPIEESPSPADRVESLRPVVQRGHQQLFHI